MVEAKEAPEAELCWLSFDLLGRQQLSTPAGQAFIEQLQLPHLHSPLPASIAEVGRSNSAEQNELAASRNDAPTTQPNIVGPLCTFNDPRDTCGRGACRRAKARYRRDGDNATAER